MDELVKRVYQVGAVGIEYNFIYCDKQAQASRYVESGHWHVQANRQCQGLP